MVNSFQKLIRGTDATLARIYLLLRRERHGVMSFLFHSLFRNQRDIALNYVDPLGRTTVQQFRQLIEYYLNLDYRFIGPDDLTSDLDPNRNYILLTFDDGYFNNSLALPILEEYKVPALFFISTDHVRLGRCFWWDVLYRERLAQGASEQQAFRDELSMKHLTTEQIEAALASRFGPSAFAPRSDVDRPFTPAELRDFARCPYVHLGNHTANHAILTNYSVEEARQQILRADAALREMTGLSPRTIAYPNGGHNAAIVQLCRDLGFTTAFTIRPGKLRLPLDPARADLLRIRRFIPHDEIPMLSQCRTYRSDILLYGLFRSVYLRLSRGTAYQ